MHCGPKITDPKSTESEILKVAGVVQVGLFNDMCDVIILAEDGGISTLVRQDGRIVL